MGQFYNCQLYIIRLCHLWLSIFGCIKFLGLSLKSIILFRKLQNWNGLWKSFHLQNLHRKFVFGVLHDLFVPCFVYSSNQSFIGWETWSIIFYKIVLFVNISVPVCQLLLGSVLHCILSSRHWQVERGKSLKIVQIFSKPLKCFSF